MQQRAGGGGGGGVGRPQDCQPNIPPDTLLEDEASIYNTYNNVVLYYCIVLYCMYRPTPCWRTRRAYIVHAIIKYYILPAAPPHIASTPFHYYTEIFYVPPDTLLEDEASIDR